MRKLVLIFLFLTCLFAGQMTAQTKFYDEIQISHVSYIKKSDGRVDRQLKIDVESKRVFYRKKPNKNYREIGNLDSLWWMTDSLQLQRIKELSKSLSEKSPACEYHNEFGYYKIELIKRKHKDEIYSESFLINQAYQCLVDGDEALIASYYTAILTLFRQLEASN